MYEYDNIYDDLKAKKEENDAALQQKKDKKVCVEFPHFFITFECRKKHIIMCCLLVKC